ncbi:MAG: Xaa-Pro peptidase family protein [Bacteroidota bacterium]|nr:Xaa-Pro peptidase family protein [Bacteroidota bacterium]MDP4232183.1 Xaa-Pro peptidase family protein [Bacteroidota bacterium]MDP4241109.1 Xaa-Pro peptidase family protein [Bacteroidota bacterium]MDP4286501.1 Xaa-Pro peptidase family protein [Bacteroidota bacterium]
MARLAKLQRIVKDKGLDALLVSHLPHIQYLIAFTGSNGLLIVPAQGKPHFFTDFRYKAQVKQEVIGAKISIVERDRNIQDALVERQLFSDYDSLGFEKQHISYALFDFLRTKFRHVKLVPETEMVEKLTVIKSEDEILVMKKAAEITDKVYTTVTEMMKPGMTEREIAAEIAYHTRLEGGERDAFNIIVASGERSALPHGAASDKKIRKNELVTLDFGCVYRGFNSDMTRTVAMGRVSTELQKIYEIVRVSQQRTIDKLHAGMNAREVDTLARDYITLHGYGSKFGHSTGHGLGIEVHEMPSLNQRGERYKLEANQVVTIEPGIYLEGIGGVRIEDDVVIRKDGCEVLTCSPKDLIVL